MSGKRTTHPAHGNRQRVPTRAINALPLTAVEPSPAELNYPMLNCRACHASKYPLPAQPKRLTADSSSSTPQANPHRSRHAA
jgi:hypothetical protein